MKKKKKYIKKKQRSLIIKAGIRHHLYETVGVRPDLLHAVGERYVQPAGSSERQQHSSHESRYVPAVLRIRIRTFLFRTNMQIRKHRLEAKKWRNFSMIKYTGLNSQDPDPYFSHSSDPEPHFSGVGSGPAFF